MKQRRTDGVPEWAKKNSLVNLLYKGFRMLRDEGLLQTAKGFWQVVLRYRRFYKLSHGIRLSGREREQQRAAVFQHPIKISLIVPLFNTPPEFLKALVESVRWQTYPQWQLCFADGSDQTHGDVRIRCEEYAAADSRIVYRKLTENRGIAGNTNAAIELSDGDYIALLDHDDFLAERALFEVAKAVAETGADFLYSDEVIYESGWKTAKNFHLKPDFSPHYLLSCNYICHLTVVSRELLERTGMYDGSFDGSQDYDFVLRATGLAEKIHHIDEPLYYWRVHSQSVASDISAKPYAYESAKRAVEAHLRRKRLEGEVIFSRAVPMLHVNFAMKSEPLVSVIIPSADHREDLRKCVESVFRSTYKNFEIIVVENNSREPETFDYYRELERDSRVRVVKWEKEFNFSVINNYGAEFAKGEQFLFLNNDIEVITPDWLEQMLMFTVQEDVGVCGIKLLYPDGSVQHAGIAVGIGGSAVNLCRTFPWDAEGYMSRLAVVSNFSAVTAACMMVKREAFERAGGFSEELAVSFNDVDLCLKIRRLGYYVVLNPVAEAYHHESKSRGYDRRGEKKKRMAREREIFRQLWPQYFGEKGDPFYHKHFGKTSDRYIATVR